MKFLFKRPQIIIHISLWLVYAAVLYYWHLSIFDILDQEHFEPRNIWLPTIVTVVSYSLIYYLNYYLLLPRFINKGKYVHYTLVILLILGGLFFLERQFRRHPMGSMLITKRLESKHIESKRLEQYFMPDKHLTPNRPPVIIRGKVPPQVGIRITSIKMAPYLAVFFISTMVWISVQNRKRQEQEVLLRNERLNAEMKFLKLQINPHFLFNALNNIYSFSFTHSPQAPQMILKLSEMLRYVVYESNEEKVKLGSEVSYIRNYIDFQRIKIEGSHHVETTFRIHNYELNIEPMLLIPFIENAFKHSDLESNPEGWIKIDMSTGGSDLFFEVTNTYNPKGGNKDKTAGIGIDNVTRRLKLLYADRHLLDIKEDEHTFGVYLKLMLG